MQLQTALDEFILAMSADGLKSKTLEWYGWALGMFVEAQSDRTLQHITTKIIRQYIVGLREQRWQYNGSQRVKLDKPLSEDTINAHTRALHRFWKWCSAEYQLINPMTTIKYPRKPKPKPKTIALEDVAALYAATGNDLVGIRNRAMLALLIDTGCRAGGLTSMLIRDLDLVQRKALVTEKGDITRKVYLIEWTVEIVREWIMRRDPKVQTVFYNFDTFEPLTVSGLRGILKRLARRAGVTGRVNPHSFRHTHAKEYMNNGGDLATLSKKLGHREMSTTVDHYLHFTEDELATKHDQHSPANALAAAQNKNAPSNQDDAV